jgi:two-component system, cell cycle sensor histidine kinase and response regulator CckA
MGALESGPFFRSADSHPDRALIKGVLAAAGGVAVLRNRAGVVVEVYGDGSDELAAEARRSVGRPPADVFCPIVAHEIVAVVGRTLQTGASQCLEYDVATAAACYTLRATTSVLDVPAGDEPLVVWLTRDVTAEARPRRGGPSEPAPKLEGLDLRARLRESQELFESFMMHAPFAAFIKKSGRYVYGNAAFEQLVPGGSWRAKTDLDLWGEGDAAVLAERESFIARTGNPHVARRLLPTPQGLRTWLTTRFAISGAVDEHLIGGIGLDVTERTRLEEQLVQAQKMESIGRLAGGVAHDFNNLLTVINAHGHFVAESLGSQHECSEDLNAMLDAAQRAGTLTRQLLIFARQEPSNVHTCDLNELTMGLDKLLRRVLGDDIELTTLPSPDGHPVDVDARQMDQVLMNLAVNARDAMPDGGRIVLATRRLLVTPEMAEARPSLPLGPCVELTMTDTGIGMDQATIRRIFEPFFTTKPEGQGTGLGLATSYGIIMRFGGDIWVESTPGEGATFHIVLPSSKGALHATPRPAATELRGRESILLVEDNDQVRDAVVRGLERYGYTVQSARSGQDALRLVEKRRFDLLLTDVNMPGMNGFELVGHVRERAPSTKVLFVSGYMEETPSRKAIRALPGVELLAKPFTPAALANKLRAMFDAK